MQEEADRFLVRIPIETQLRDVTLSQLLLLESLDNSIHSEKVLHRSNDIVDVVKLIMLHVLPQKHVCLALNEAFDEHFDGVLVGDHGVFEAVIH